MLEIEIIKVNTTCSRWLSFRYYIIETLWFLFMVWIF